MKRDLSIALVICALATTGCESPQEKAQRESAWFHKNEAVRAGDISDRDRDAEP